jgi:hypothetical protein
MLVEAVVRGFVEGRGARGERESFKEWMSGCRLWRMRNYSIPLSSDARLSCSLEL